MVFLMPSSKVVTGSPQFDVRPVQVDRIPLVMSMPIRNMGNQRLRFVQLRENPLNDIEVVPLVVAAQIVDFADPPLSMTARMP